MIAVLEELENQLGIDESWNSKKADADGVSELYFSIRNPKHQIWWRNFQSYADRINQCATVLEFGPMPDMDGVIKLKLKTAYFCHVRFCPVCAWRRVKKWQKRLLEAKPLIESDFIKYRWIFLTLTVKNCDTTNLRETITHMNKGFVRLSQLKSFPAKGWIKSIEVTKGKVNDKAHPHIHALLLVPPGYFKGGKYLSQEQWQKLWRKSARLDYDPVIDVRAVKDREGSLIETVKYMVKSSDLKSDEEWLAEITKQLFKTRAVSIGGKLRPYIREQEPSPDEPECEENEGGEFRFWNKKQKKYL